MNWTILDGFAVKANRKRLENLEKISNNNAIVAIENTIQSIILQYYNCVLQKNQLNVLQEIVLLADGSFTRKKSTNLAQTIKLIICKQKMRCLQIVRI